MKHPDGFGYLHSYDDDDENKKENWKKVVDSHIQRSENRKQRNGFFSQRYVDTVRKLLPYFESYFDKIKPEAFLDDTTTKNLLIKDGRISGIIDLDWICFGDRLYVIALTTMSLLNMNSDLVYIDFWKELEHLTQVQNEALLFNTLVFCLDFMAEKGMKFNKEVIREVSISEVNSLKRIFEDIYEKLQLTFAST